MAWISRMCGGGVGALLGVSAVGGCHDAISEQEQLVFEDEALVRDPGASFRSGDPVRVGTRFCPEFAGWMDDAGEVHDEDPETLQSCFMQEVSGPANLEAGCVVLDEPGMAAWELTPLACPVQQQAGVQFGPDRLAFRVVSSDALEARIDFWQERAGERELAPGSRGRFPDDWIPPPQKPLGVAADQALRLPIGLFEQQALGFVAWHGPDATVEVRAVAGDPWWQRDADTAAVEVRMQPGDGAALELAFADQRYPVGTVQGVALGDLADLELVAAYLPAEGDETGPPVGARAIVRDASGRMVVGAPVRWTLLEGNLAVDRAEEDDPRDWPDYVELEDGCEPAPEAPQGRTAVLAAEIEGSYEELQLEWIARPRDEAQPFEPDEDCPGFADAQAGCGCRSGDGGGPGGWGWAVIPLLVRRRPVRS